ncbi:MAG: hypothetical protein IMY72_13080 [Bacteroidetes bacterium]|nr:hypothetical protein [Bacteroidota bacterium]
MLFFLDKHFVVEVQRNNAAAISAVNLISLGRKHGKHMLLADRESLKQIRDCLNVNNDTKRVFTYLYENYPTFAYIKDILSFYVKIVTGSKHMLLSQSGNVNVFELSFDYIQEINIVTETIVIGENQMDIIFYNFLSNYYKSKHHLNSVPSCYSPRMGGGSTTHIVYSSIQELEQNFCLCFVDSDKKYPTANVGDTLKAVQRIDDSSRLLAHLHALDSREIENIIPLSILEKVCEEDVNYKSGFDTLKKIVKNENKKDILYLDFKNGLSLKNYRKIKDENLKIFLDNLLINSDLFSRVTLDGIYNQENEIETETEMLFQGLGSNVLDRTIKYLGENELIEPQFDFAEQIIEWTIIGEKFANWTCCGTKIR